MSAAPQPAERVAVERLVRRYGELVAVDGISFRVERGEMFGLIGPDGAGKTTTLRVILGLLAPLEQQKAVLSSKDAGHRRLAALRVR